MTLLISKLVKWLALIAAVLMVSLAAAKAQQATLLADSVDINGDTTITASGNVQVFYGDVRVSAAAIVYDSTSDTLVITGPIRMTDGPETVIVASQADLSPDLRDGIMRSASVILNQQMQIAATEIARVGGRYTQMYQTVASSCKVCAANPVPLWEIRSRKIVHDQEVNQLYFYSAQIRIAGVPVMYFPRLRLPGPSLKRARGFLVPSAYQSSTLGAGMRIPYFFPFGSSADLTVTPNLSEITSTLELRYRQEFWRGGIELNGAITEDDLEDDLRYYLFTKGAFDLPRGYDLTFSTELTSDSTYLLEYDYSTSDRLENEIALTRTRNNEYIRAGLLGFETLRGSELAINEQLPNFQGEFLIKRRFYPSAIGGQGMWQLDLQGHGRESTDDEIGRDVLRLGGKLDWTRSWLLDGGAVARIGARVTADNYWVYQDDNYETRSTNVIPAIEAELRWPLVRSSRNGVVEALEPVAHIAWTDQAGDAVPNEDSTLVEFDEGNLFSLSRFPGSDRYEAGLRATVGLQYTRMVPSGNRLTLTGGKVFRAEDLNQFSQASGLSGKSSDWLLAGRLQMNEGITLGARALVRDNFSLDKAEAQLALSQGKFGLISSYTWIVEDPSEARADGTAQMRLDANYNLGRYWNTTLDWRYDFEAQRATRAEFGVAYSNECVNVGLSVSRRFTSSTTVEPTTNYNLAVSFNGFGGGGRADQSGCSG